MTDHPILRFARRLVLAALTLGAATQGTAQDATPKLTGLGQVGLFTNDYLGDGHDRWRSGSKWESYVLPSRVVEAWEFRWRTEIISPWKRSSATDRQYVDGIGLAGFAHLSYGNLNTRVGAESLWVGPQTGLAALQKRVHAIVGTDRLHDPDGPGVSRIGDQWLGMMSAETSYEWRVGRNVLLRPYGGVQMGYETFSRAGVDVVIGAATQAPIWVRDPASGALMPITTDRTAGLSVIGGADITHVRQSDLLQGVTPEGQRHRARLGLQWQGQRATIFAGQAWLSPEFVGQSEGQRIGLLSLSLSF